MDFQRARTKEQIENRQNEILNSCVTLYEEMDYDNITLKMISDRTSLSRTTMYSYYKTKEEIFLDLMKREYLRWNDALAQSFSCVDGINRESFCNIVADSLLNRNTFLRLLSIQQTVIEKNISHEQLVKFKKDMSVIFSTLDYGIEMAFPNADAARRKRFIMHLTIYITSFYPCTHPIKVQIDAMSEAGIEFPPFEYGELLSEEIYHLTGNI